MNVYIYDFVATDLTGCGIPFMTSQLLDYKTVRSYVCLSMADVCDLNFLLCFGRLENL